MKPANTANHNTYVDNRYTVTKTYTQGTLDNKIFARLAKALEWKSELKLGNGCLSRYFFPDCQPEHLRQSGCK